MSRLTRSMLVVSTASALLMAVTAASFAKTPQEKSPEPKGLGDPGKLESLEIGPNQDGEGVTIVGRDARQQLFVTGNYSSGQVRDFTHKVQYTSSPEGIVEISATGYVKPLDDGDAVVQVKGPQGMTAELPVHVERVHDQVPINFANQIIPIFTKLGCNSGGCHGKSGGQNGFALSLLGFYPRDDYEYLVKEARGRRIFPPAPGESLLLQKPTGQVPHGGGKRMEVGSYEYRMLYRWIEQGMPYGSEDDPHVVGIECRPKHRVMDRGADQQITVVAEYSDGSTKDVTRMALYEANNTEMAEVTENGLVKTLDLAGEVAIMARYQAKVATFRATIPLGAPTDDIPEPENFVDRAAFQKLRMLGIPPSKVCDDSTFLRRAYLDITGTLPTEREVSAFLRNDDPRKREQLVDRLLDTKEYADHFANKWNLVLRNKTRGSEDRPASYMFYRWIWQNIYENKPYDEFVREILTASGEPRNNPPVVWYREVDERNEQVEDTAQLFLGLRIQCARCHHHPFEKWSQDDYYGFAAFFSRVDDKNIPALEGTRRDRREKRIYHNDGTARARNPRSGEQLAPTGLGGEPLDIPDHRDPRQYLADWMADEDNPFFARALVNRYWKHFFSRGIVEPEDDMRATNPPSNPELLNKLSQDFIDSGFDLKELVRTICTSKTYQLSSIPNDYNVDDKQNFSRYYPKRLKAEVLYAGFHQVTGTSQRFNGLPDGTTALELPDPSVGPYFLKVFGQPQADTACECERSQEANLAQSLHLLNSNEVQNKISSGGGRAAQLAGNKELSDKEKIRKLYRWVYARDPKPDEMKVALAHIEKHKDNPKTAFEDILWALINTKEFLFNH